MVVSESKRKGDMKGRPNPAQENCDGSDLDICPDLILAALGAALAAAFAVLFTLITAAGRRKKRSTDAYTPVQLSTVLEDLSWNLGKSKSIHQKNMNLDQSCSEEFLSPCTTTTKKSVCVYHKSRPTQTPHPTP